jgi:hypothetical protein
MEFAYNFAISAFYASRGCDSIGTATVNSIFPLAEKPFMKICGICISRLFLGLALKISLIHEQLLEIYQRLLPICEILEIKEPGELSGLVFSPSPMHPLSLLRRSAAAALKSRS